MLGVLNLATWSTHLSLITHSELILSASSCLWWREVGRGRKKIVNSLETPVPWAVWCHWTRPPLSRNRSSLVDGMHTGASAYEAARAIQGWLNI